MSTSNQSTGYALLIGVDDYSAYDASVKAAPEDTNDLRGSVNDVRAWYRLCRELGYPAENIRVLASPEIARPELEGATVGPATSDAIRAGVAWLADKLGAPDKPAGVLTFSGHGGMSQKGLIVCPTDVKQEGDEIVNAVHLVEIQATIAKRNAGRNLTAIFDCCRAGRGQGSQPTALQRILRAAYHEIAAPAIGDRMFFAADPRTAGYQAELGGRWHGAFTWAFMTVKDQWSIVEDANGNRELTISYEDMRARTEALLSALAFEQQPALVCRPGAMGMPVFNRGPATDADTTSDTPDAARSRIQLDPGHKGYRLYTITYSVNSSFNTYTTVGQVLVPNTGATFGSLSFVPGTEYWYLTNNVPTTSQYYLRFSWVDYDWTTSAPTVGTQSFTMNQNPSWSSTTVPSSSYSNYMVNGQYQFCLTWGLTVSGGVWNGTLTWWNNTGASTVLGGTTSSTSQVTLRNNQSASTYWYKTAVSKQ